MDNSSGVGVLDKAALVLAALEAGPATLAGLVAGTGLARPTAHRLAVALEHHRLVARDMQGRFVLGPRLSELSAAAGEDRLLASAGPVLARLRDITGESAQLWRRQGEYRVCVAAAERPTGLRDTIPVGSQLTMRAGSAAQILLAWEDPERMHRGLQNAAYSATALAGIRRRGWSQSVGEREQGVASVSAPVRAPSGKVIAAVSVSGPARAALAPARPDACSRGAGRGRPAVRVTEASSGRIGHDMWISELSDRTRVPIDTIKHYLRIGVLHRGRPIAHRRSEYDETHVERIRLIRAMIEIGGMRLDSVRRVFDSVDESQTSLRDALGQAHYELSQRFLEDHEPTAGSLATVDGVIARQGWHIAEDSVHRAALAASLDTLGRGGQLGQRRPPRLLRPGWRARSRPSRSPTSTRAAAATRRSAVSRSVRALYEPLIVLLRRLAQEHASRDWAAEASWLPTEPPPVADPEDS